MRRFLARMAFSVLVSLVLLTGAHADNGNGREGTGPHRADRYSTSPISMSFH